MADYVKPADDVRGDPIRSFLLSIADEVDRLRQYDQHVVFRATEPPAEHTVRLMRTLGVPIEVTPVSAIATTGVPIYCPHPACGWSYERGGARGEGFLAVHLRVVHKDVDPRTNTTGDANTHQKASNGSVEPRREDTAMDMTPVRKWSRDLILDAFRRFQRERGRWPLASEECDYLPGRKAVNHHFRSWQAVLDELDAGKIPRARAAQKYVATGDLPTPTSRSRAAKPSGRKRRLPSVPEKRVSFPPSPAVSPAVVVESPEPVRAELGVRPEVSPIFDNLIAHQDELRAEADRLDQLSVDAAGKRDTIHMLLTEIAELTSG